MSRRRAITFIIVLYITFAGGTAYGHSGAIPDVIRLLFIVGPAAGWLAELIRTRRPFPRTPLDAPLAALAVWLVVAALFALDRRISLEMIWTFLAYILGFYLLVDLIRRDWLPDLKAAFLAVALGLVGISAVELAAWYFGWLGQPGWFPVEGLARPVPPAFAPLDLALNVSTIQGNYLATLLPLVIAGALALRRWRLPLLALAAILLGLEVLTFSRGGLLGALAAIGLLLAFAALRWARRYGRAIVLRPGFALAALTVAALAGGLLIMVWTAQNSRADSDLGRLDTWRSALEMVRDDPVTGVGPGLFGMALRTYRDPALAQDRLVSAHNLPLHLLAELGVPGFLLIAWALQALVDKWWRTWRAAAPERRLWLEGAAAALVAYGTHSLVDVFPLPSSVLPVLLATAYIVAEPQPAPYSLRRSRRLAWGALAVIAAYAIWIATLDVAQGWMTLSRHNLNEGDLDAALEHAERARAWDPALSLYDLHEAYVLGLLANRDPDRYLDRAIAAHEAALAQQPTFDIGWANLSALYEQRGDAEAAEEALRRAAEILPRNALYWLKLGDTARALAEDHDLAAEAPKIDPAGLRRYLHDGTQSAAARLYVAVLAGAESEANRLALLAAQETSWLARLALGLYTHRIVGDDVAAREYLSEALRSHPLDERAALERAEIALAHGDLSLATRDARYALFVDPHGGAPGNYVLARVAARTGDPDAVEGLLKDSIALRPQVQYFASTVYARPAAFRYLPQFGALRTSFRAYDGGLALADYYRARGAIDDARDVYSMLLYENPYLTEAEAASAALPASHDEEDAP